MHPILIDLGFIKIYSYAFFLGLGFYFAILVALYKAKKLNINEDNFINFCIIVLITALISSRLMYIITDFKNIGYYLRNPLVILQFHGLVFYGGFIGAVVVGLYLIKIYKFKLGVIADIAAPSISLGLAFARIGCFLNGCCYGVKTTLPIGVKFPNLACHCYRHPTQLYSSFYALIIFFILEYLYKNKKKFDGYIFLIFLIIYGTARFFIEFLRDDYRGVFFFNNSLSVSQLISLIAIIISTGLIIYNNRKI